MTDWIERLNLILQMSGKEILTHAGKISHALAVSKSEKEYEKFKAKQKKLEQEESLSELEADVKLLKES